MSSAPSSSGAGRRPKKKAKRKEMLNEECAEPSLPEADVQHERIIKDGMI